MVACLATRSTTILHRKIFDAGSAFSLMQEEAEDGRFMGWKALASREDGLKVADEESIYLIDHAWTFRPETAKGTLREHPNLLERMATLMGIDTEDKPSKNELIEAVMEEKWKFVQTYWVGNASRAEDKVPIWYVMDEFGARIQHSEAPNVRVVPFLSLLDGSAYSILFPTQDLASQEEITRDYLEGPESGQPLVRKALMNTWKFEDMKAVAWEQEEPGEDFFAVSCDNESVPDPSFQAQPLPIDRKIRVFSEYDVIVKNLKHPKFEIVDSQEDADVLWLLSHFRDYKTLSEDHPAARINQFPFESVLTIKDHLSVVCRRKSEELLPPHAYVTNSPKWLPTTFNLKSELPKFVSYYQHREALQLDNHWIVKPRNLARGLDMHITNHLPYILRLPFGGPKIAQKYIERPVFFQRPGIGPVKFDIRHILLLQSTDPLKVYVYNRFWLRFANQAFELKDFDIYEKHFTVMNYVDKDLKQMFCQDFIKDFEAQNPGVSWKSVETSIHAMLKQVFEAAVSKSPPSGIARSPQSRAMYASDLMLAWEKDPKTGEDVIQPKILEINWAPDCQRACDYYPDFFDNVFSTLFLNDPQDQHVTLL
eukprot:snap_masked-scaffold702_size109376-processed-gene-0.1 protein:Tk12092 transcript:snap_masked-scaffold702_size109376-processed-gene-0.1-mRNA-1 annotation:"tubulin--tyrosine ligase-like protein 12"